MSFGLNDMLLFFETIVWSLYLNKLNIYNVSVLVTVRAQSSSVELQLHCKPFSAVRGISGSWQFAVQFSLQIKRTKAGAVQFSWSLLSKTVVKLCRVNSSIRERKIHRIALVHKYSFGTVIQQCWIHGKRQTNQLGDRKRGWSAVLEVEYTNLIFRLSNFTWIRMNFDFVFRFCFNVDIF